MALRCGSVLASDPLPHTGTVQLSGAELSHHIASGRIPIKLRQFDYPANWAHRLPRTGDVHFDRPFVPQVGMSTHATHHDPAFFVHSAGWSPAALKDYYGNTPFRVKLRAGRVVSIEASLSEMQREVEVRGLLRGTLSKGDIRLVLAAEGWPVSETIHSHVLSEEAATRHVQFGRKGKVTSVTNRVHHDPNHQGQIVAQLLDVRNSSPLLLSVSDLIDVETVIPRYRSTSLNAEGTVSIRRRTLTKLSSPRLTAIIHYKPDVRSLSGGTPDAVTLRFGPRRDRQLYTFALVRRNDRWELGELRAGPELPPHLRSNLVAWGNVLIGGEP